MYSQAYVSPWEILPGERSLRPKTDREKRRVPKPEGGTGIFAHGAYLSVEAGSAGSQGSHQEKRGQDL